MTGPTRVRVVTPERLDALVSNLVNTSGTATSTAVATKAGTSSGGSTTGVTAATANTIMGRDASARSQVADPAVNADVANMGWTNTTISSYVTSQKGIASGIASLDSSSFLNSVQVPQYLHQHRGSGTAFPTGIRAGDTFLHTGVGCLFSYDGTNWRQAEEFSVATNAAVTAISSTYSSAIHTGFRVWQTDWNVERIWNGTVWGVSSGLMLGKMWGTTGIGTAISSGSQAISFNASRTTGGVTFASSKLTLPLDGCYELSYKGYTTGGATGAVAWDVYRTRTSVADTVCESFQYHKANTGSDECAASTAIVPLKASDKLSLTMIVANTSGGLQPVLNNETVGCMLQARYAGPLNGATPL